MKHLFFLVCIALLFASVTLAPQKAKDDDGNCNELLQRADKAMDKILFLGDPTLITFTSKEDLSENYCKPFLGYLREITNYSKCLRAFSKTMLNIIATNIKRIHKSICYSNAKLSEAYSHVKCMDANTKVPLTATTETGVAFVTAVSKLEDVDEIIPGLCCGSLIYFEDMEVVVNNICQTRTGDATGKYIMGVIKNVFGDAVDMMCGKYPSKESCISQKPELFQSLKTTMTNVTKQSSSFTIPLVTLVKRLDGLSI